MPHVAAVWEFRVKPTELVTAGHCHCSSSPPSQHQMMRQVAKAPTLFIIVWRVLTVIDRVKCRRMLCINKCVKMRSASDEGISNYPSDFEFGKNVRNPPTFEFEFELRHIPNKNPFNTPLSELCLWERRMLFDVTYCRAQSWYWCCLIVGLMHWTMLFMLLARNFQH